MKVRYVNFVCILAVLFLAVYAKRAGYKERGVGSQLHVSSQSFAHEGNIPDQFTCAGKNIVPHISWTDAPDGAKSFALICDDPDAPKGTWVHWIVFNIPSNVTEVGNGMPIIGIQGNNSWDKPSYGGPCPPAGKAHRYVFTIYALNTMLNLKLGATKEALLQAMQGHVLAQGVLIGLYQKR